MFFRRRNFFQGRPITADVKGQSPGAAVNTTSGVLETLDSKSLLLSLQYFTPLDTGNVWLSLGGGFLLGDHRLRERALLGAGLMRD